jgi:tripartite-type tricarboxylate transporter receptor subunit TctC
MKRLSRALAVVAVTMCGALWLALPAGAQTVAQAWPPKTIRIIIPFPPGGTTDLIARRAQPMLERNLKVSILIENRGGASGAIGTQAAVASAPDGATFVLVFDTHGANPSLLPNLPFDTMKDLAPVTLIGISPMVITTHQSTAYKSFADVMTAAKSGSVAYGTIGAGSLAHLAMSQIGNALNVSITHVPYKGGGPLVNDAIAGHVPVAIASIALLSPHIKSGALRPLAATSPKRIALLPDTPTVGESGVPGFDAVSWWGLLAPAKTPPEIVARMNTAIADALNDPTVKQNLSEQGVDYRLSSPDEFGRFVEAEIKRWAKVVKDNNIVVKD